MMDLSAPWRLHARSCLTVGAVPNFGLRTAFGGTGFGVGRNGVGHLDTPIEPLRRTVRD